MKTLAVIPARLGATRLPDKPLRELAGRPLIVRVWERVMSLGVADAVVVATDSEAIAKVVRDAHGEAALTSSAHPSGTDRVAEVASLPAYVRYDAVINVQGDEPFLDGTAARGALALVTTGRFPLGTASARANADVLGAPNVVKVVTADDGRAMYFSRAPIPFLRDQADAVDRDDRIRQHLGIYAYTREALSRWVGLPPHPLERIERLEQLRPLAAGLPMGVAETDAAPLPGIDTEEDLARANASWAQFTRTSSVGHS